MIMQIRLLAIIGVLLFMVFLSGLLREGIQTPLIREIPFMISVFSGLMFAVVGSNHNYFWFSGCSFLTVLSVQGYYVVIVGKEEKLNVNEKE